MREMIAAYAPPSENDSERYLRDILIGLFADYPVVKALEIVDRQPSGVDDKEVPT